MFHSRATILPALAIWLATLSTTSRLWSQDSPPKNTAEIVQTFVDETTFLIVRFDPQKLELESLTDALATISPALPQSYALHQERAQQLIQKFAKLSKGRPIFVTASVPASAARPSLFLFFETDESESLVPIQETIGIGDSWQTYRHQSYWVCSQLSGATADAGARPAETERTIELASRSVQQYPLQAIIVPPQHIVRTIRELSPQLPPQLGGGPSSVLTDGVQWISVGIDPKNLTAEWTIQSHSTEAANNLVGNFPKLVRAGFRALRSQNKLIPETLIEPLLNWIQPEVHGTQLHKKIGLADKDDLSLSVFTKLAVQAEETFQKATKVNKVRQILLGLHNFHEANKHLPPGDPNVGPDGQALLSWRVYLLPYLEQQELFQQFHLNEAWDSPHNKLLLEKIPDIYANNNLLLSTTSVPKGYTTCVAPVGPKTIFGRPVGVSFSKVIDGLSNTVAIVEVTPAMAVPWTAPQDYPFDPENPLAGIRIDLQEQWLIGRGDGSSQFLPKSLDAETVRRLFEMNDGQPIHYEE
ncbi:DUF1559 family PulG-like putative transporter [Aureliella helgolandensis]|uniref:DUF1559 domain-containing protein n=1 Tax=Aureliella helgolandensis TaxID=2527968 RepID=A0A518GGR4_9BACT|nr:DUF1559 domain-containing protein [Aureliella helgolandensis]QDV27786.1 hypothetical protein Q31a_61790 [Aureliella helgolandensis]